MDKIIWLIDDDWYAGKKVHRDSVGPYIHADVFRKLVEEMKDECQSICRSCGDMGERTSEQKLMVMVCTTYC